MRHLLLSIVFISFNAIAATVIPFERDLPRYEVMDYLAFNNYDSIHYTTHFAGFYSGVEFYRGFSIANYGPNEIVTSTPVDFDPASRDFQFITEDKSRSETYLWLSDYNGSGYLSDRYETIITFLPRVTQPHVEEHDDELLVTLPTGEEITFNKKYKTLTRGVLLERPLNYKGGNTDISYTGTGIMLRADSKGSDPRKAKNLKVIKGNQKPCLIPTIEFWTKGSFPIFKFAHDEDAYRVIEAFCGKSYLP